MNRSLALLLGSTMVGALIAACSASPDTGSLPGRHSSSGGPSAGTTDGTQQGGSSNPTPSDPSGNGTTPQGSGPSQSLQPPPSAGPGSTASPAHQFFESTVFPKLANCAACHSTGTDGAPKMMESPAATAYQELDARGLIVTNSLLLTHGSHDTGKAPALSADQQSAVTQWLSMEATERQGQAAPTNVLADVAKCVDENLWNQIGWSQLRTQPRTNENPNRCTGCNQATCRTCHEGGEAGFFMAEGSNLQPPGTTFHETFKGSQASTFMVKYFGLNGTTPVASNAIMTKMQAVATGPAYSHPMFVMSQTMQTALNTFVQSAITNYTNKTCTGTSPAPADAGTD